MGITQFVLCEGVIVYYVNSDNGACLGEFETREAAEAFIASFEGV